MRVTSLASSKDPLFKRLRELRTREGRDRHREFLLEDEESVQAALAAGLQPSSLLATAACLEQPPAWLAEQGRSVHQVSPGLMHKLFPTGKQPRVVAALGAVSRPLTQAPSAQKLLVLEEIQDAGNVGTILRTAAGLGVRDVVIMQPGATDPFNRVAVRASMGALFRVRLWNASLEDLRDYCRAHSLPLLCSTPHTERTIGSVSLARWAVVVGNETQGASEAMLAAADYKVRIPMDASTESLNVAVATGVALYALSAVE